MITLKYAAFGIFSYLIYLGLLIFFIEIFNFEKLKSSIITYLIALIINFLLLKKWVFKSKNDYTNQFVKYNIIATFGYFLNILGFFILATIFEIHYLISQCILFFLISVINYFLNRYWTFKFD